MPTSARVPMGTVRAKILDASAGGVSAYLHNVGTGNVFLGDETVTPATGFELPGNAIMGPIAAWPGSDLWGVRAAGASIVHVLEQRRW